MKNILIPISFSETSTNALQSANQIAKQYGATLSLLHCYPPQDYNQEYDFGTVDYDKGIKQMLIELYKKNIAVSERQPLRLLTHAGSVSDAIVKFSHKFNLLVLCRRIGSHPKSSTSLSEKTFYFTTKSLCPVLLIPSNRDGFTFSEIKNIWHIQRKPIENELINKLLLELKVDPRIVISKSLAQKTFTSVLWRSIINYSKTHDAASLKQISDSFDEEHIDLLILVNHAKGMFERFLKDDAFLTMSQFDLPILILVSNSDTA
jgi:nucleotide-binding universal stress UspA family protein